MSRLSIKTLVAATAASLALLLSACGGSGGSEGGIGGSGAALGTLRLSLTDAPACGFDHVNITVQQVSVNQNASAGDADPGWVDITLPVPQKIDLLNLSNGVLLTLGQTPLAVGTYTQLRLVLAANSANDPLANSVVPTGGAEVPLTTPSGQQSGIKANIDITIAANQLADFVVDFNACKSVVSAGNSGKYLLKPVIDVVPNFISGVQGYVDATLSNGQTLVSLEQGGVVVKSTVPDATGKFLLEPVAPGTYDLVITAPARASAVVRAVSVASALLTVLEDASAPISLPASATGIVSGTVTTGVVPIDAQLAAAQTLDDGDVVVVDEVPADSVTGAYAMTLPTGAPLVAPFVSGVAPVFTAQADVAGHYAIDASSAGVAKTTAVTLLGGTTQTVNFTFP